MMVTSTAYSAPEVVKKAREQYTEQCVCIVLYIVLYIILENILIV